MVHGQYNSSLQYQPKAPPPTPSASAQQPPPPQSQAQILSDRSNAGLTSQQAGYLHQQYYTNPLAAAQQYAQEIGRLDSNLIAFKTAYSWDFDLEDSQKNFVFFLNLSRLRAYPATHPFTWNTFVDPLL